MLPSSRQINPPHRSHPAQNPVASFTIKSISRIISEPRSLKKKKKFCIPLFNRWLPGILPVLGNRIVRARVCVCVFREICDKADFLLSCGCRYLPYTYVTSFTS